MRKFELGWTNPSTIIAGMASGTMIIMSAILSYWIFFDVNPPLTVIYRHDRFTAVPVSKRELLPKFEIDVVPAGSTVYIYEESCRSKNTIGTVTRLFIGEYIFSLPIVRTTSIVGCEERSYAVRAPNLPGTYEYVVRIEYENNPVRNSVYNYAPMQVVVK